MKLSQKNLIEIVDKILDNFQDVFDNLENKMTEKLKEEIDIQFITYKKSISVRDNWCCCNMQKFAANMWHINQPAKNRDNFGVTYRFRNMDIIYCPFCGVKL